MTGKVIKTPVFQKVHEASQSEQSLLNGLGVILLDQPVTLSNPFPCNLKLHSVQMFMIDGPTDV